MMADTVTGVSLFTGAGGMDIGFENAGVKVVVANELVKEAAETYKTNHSNCVMINDDINNVINDMAKYEGADFVFGGPPCQGFSVAGKMDPNDERSKLIFTFLDVVEKVQPKAFVMENVKALGVLEKWEPTRKKYLERATKMGYQCMPFILNASEYGVSQKRERVFFIGIKSGLDPFFEHHMMDEEYLYGNAECDWVVDYHQGLIDGRIVPEFKDAPSRLRRITIKEAAKIQTFPDNYIFCGNKGKVYTQIGNAVPCKLAEAVARAVIEYQKKYV